MVISYIGSGKRDYEKLPIKVNARPRWELMAVVDGRIRLWLPDRIEPPRQRTFWVFPPGAVHGWRGVKGKSAQVIIFHLEELPEPTAGWVRHLDWLTTSLTSRHIQQLQGLLAESLAERQRPSLLRMMRWQRIALDLAILIGDLIAGSTQPANEKDAKDRERVMVENAIRNFTNHLHEGWTFELVCDSLSVSPVHLRRLFHKVMNTHPREVLEEVRFRHAMQAMMLPNAKIESVAEEVGFQSTAAFSRAFKRWFADVHKMPGISPTKWIEDRLAGKHGPNPWAL